MEKKSNLVAIIGVVLLVINLALTSVIIFFTIPMISKTDKILTQVSKVLNVELGYLGAEGTGTIPIDQIDFYKIAEDGISINVAAKDGKGHILRVKPEIGVNSKAKDYAKVSEQIGLKEAKIVDEIYAVAAQYSYEDIKQVDTVEKIKTELINRLQMIFATDSIVDLYFNEFIYN